MLELLFAILSLIAHLFVFQFYEGLADYYYFAVMVVTSTLVLHYSVKKIREDKLQINWREGLIFFIILCGGLLFHDAKSIWLDEHSQAIFSGPAYKCLTCSAGIEQQPPLSYVFSSFSLKYLGETSLSLRLLPIIFFTISCVYFWRILKFFNVCDPLAILGLVFYCLNSQIFYFSLEARPYSLFLMAALWSLLSYLKIYQNDDVFSAPYLWAMVMFLMMSIGLQAQIFALVLFILYVFTYRQKFRKEVFWANALAGILFLPILIVIYKQSIVMEQFKTFHFESALVEMLKFLIDYIQDLLSTLGPLPIELGVGLLAFVLSLKTSHKERRAILWAFLLFSFFFLFVYMGFINWKMISKYYLLSFPLILVMFVMGIQFLIDRLSPFWPKSLRFLLLFTFILRGLFFLLDFEDRNMAFLDWRDVPWKGFYQHVREKIADKDKVYFLSYASIGDWYQNGPIGAEFYLENDLLSHLVKANNDIKLPAFYEEEEIGGSVYIVSPQSWSDDTMSDVLLTKEMTNLEVLYWDGVRVFRLKENGHSHSVRLIDFFSVIIKNYGNFSWSAPAWHARGELCRILQKNGCLDDSIEGLSKVYIPFRENNAGSVVVGETIRKSMINTLYRVTD